jgi:hypothetical protein
MYRSPWELDTHIRYVHERLANERRLCAGIDAADAAPAKRLTGIRQRVGIGLIQIGAVLAGSDALRGLAVLPARPATSHR